MSSMLDQNNTSHLSHHMKLYMIDLQFHETNVINRRVTLHKMKEQMKKYTDCSITDLNNTSFLVIDKSYRNDDNSYDSYIIYSK